jgi:hypothetical protein
MKYKIIMWIVAFCLFIISVNSAMADKLDYENCSDVTDWTGAGITSDAVDTYNGSTCQYDKGANSRAWWGFKNTSNPIQERLSVSFVWRTDNTNNWVNIMITNFTDDVDNVIGRDGLELMLDFSGTAITERGCGALTSYVLNAAKWHNITIDFYNLTGNTVADIYINKSLIKSACDITGNPPVTELQYFHMAEQGTNVHNIDDIRVINNSYQHDYLNLSIPSPANNHQFGYADATFNLTINNSFTTNCSLYINSTWNQSINYSAGQNTAVSFTRTFNMLNPYYSYYVGCKYNSTGSASTSTRNFSFGTTFNITFKDAINESVVNWEEVFIDFISDDLVYNYSTLHGNMSAVNIYPGTYTLRYYSADAYPHHFYEIDVNNNSIPLTLYFTNTTNEITVNVFDSTTLSTLSGAMVYLQRYYSTPNQYITVGMYETSDSGKAYFYADTTEYYRFLVDYPFGTRRLETAKMYFEETTINLYVPTTEEVAEIFYDAAGITYSITSSETARTFTATFTDYNDVAGEFCLYVKEHGYYGRVELNKSCLTANSGTIVRGFPSVNKTYYALLTAKINGDERNIATGWITLVGDELDAGNFGVFLSTIIVVVFSFLSAFHIMAMFFAMAGLIFAKLLGLLAIQWGYVFYIVIASIILAIIIQMKK